uniref:Homologous-pairing protein 2 homolog n=1 Tax=Mastacembelus armatus TaxID=205130 RepID=A0A7N9AUJ2_9TELE
MSKKDNGASIILAYLNEKNRPYSAQDVFCNLQQQHGLGKTAVVKAMELLAVEGKIKEKIYGKQKIYFADQAQFKDVSDADLKAMDCQLAELSAEAQSLAQSCRQLDAELKELNSSLTTEEMISETQQLKEECSGYRARLQKIKSATSHVTPEEKEKVGCTFNVSKISIEHVTVFLSKYVSKGAIDMKSSLDVGNNPCNPHMQGNQTIDVHKFSYA